MIFFLKMIYNIYMANNATDKVQTLHKAFSASWEKMENELSIDKLKDSVREELHLDAFVLQEEAMNNTEKHHEYIVRLFECKKKQSYYARFEKVLYKLLYEYYKHESPEGPFRTKDDYHRHIYAHETWVLLKQIQDHINQVTDYLQYVERLFGERNFSIGAVSRIMGN